MKHYVIWIVAFATLANADFTNVTNTASKTEGKAFAEKSSFSSLSESAVKSKQVDGKQSKQQEQFRSEQRHLDKFSSHQENKSQKDFSNTSTQSGNKSQVVKQDVTSSQSNVEAVKKSSSVYTSSSSQSSGCNHPQSHDANQKNKSSTIVEKSSYSNQISSQQKSSSSITEQSSISHNESNAQEQKKKAQSNTDTSMYTRNVKFIIHKEKKGYSEEQNTNSSNSNLKHRFNSVYTATSSSASKSESINKTSVNKEENDYPKPHIKVLRLKKKPQTNKPCIHQQNINDTKTNSQSNKTGGRFENNRKKSKVKNSKSKSSVKKNIRRTIIEETNEDYYCEKHRHLKHDAEQEPVSEPEQEVKQQNCNHTVQPEKLTPKPEPAPKRVQENHGKNKQINNSKRSKSSVKKKKVTIVEEEVYCAKHSQRKRKSNKKSKSDQHTPSNPFEQHINSTETIQHQSNNRSANASETNKKEEVYYCDKHRPKSQPDNNKTPASSFQPDQVSHNNNHTNPVHNNKKPNLNRMSQKRVNKSSVKKKKTQRTIIEESEENYYCDKHKEFAKRLRKNKNANNSTATDKPNLDHQQTGTQKQNDKSNFKQSKKSSVTKKKKKKVTIIEENEEYQRSARRKKSKYKKTHNPEQNPTFKPTNGTVDTKHEPKSVPQPVPLQNDKQVPINEPNKTSHQQEPHTEDSVAEDSENETSSIKKINRKFYEEHHEENYHSEQNVASVHEYNYKVKPTEDGHHIITDKYLDGKPVINRKLPKGIDKDTIIKLRTLVVNDGSGRCYCTCDTGTRPVFFSVPRHKFKITNHQHKN